MMNNSGCHLQIINMTSIILVMNLVVMTMIVMIMVVITIVMILVQPCLEKNAMIND